MTAARARRRWLRWQRYVRATGSHTTSRNLGGYHLGFVLAHDRVMHVGRYVPIGVRQPWYLPGAHR